MKKSLTIAPAITAAAALLVTFGLVHRWARSPAVGGGGTPETVTNSALSAESGSPAAAPRTAATGAQPGSNSASGLPAHVLREVPNAVQRLAALERLGEVPQDATEWDWWLAQRTTWWGKRLDPHAFWRDRPIWGDRAADMAAHRHGRLFPPMPYEVPALASRSDTDESTMSSADNPDVHFRLTDRERAFWDLFSRTHPKAPEQLVAGQLELARVVLGNRRILEAGDLPRGIRAENLAHSSSKAREDLLALGYPPEALTDEAVYWANIMDQRAMYEQVYVQMHSEHSASCSNFLRGLGSDASVVSQPLTAAQLKAANAWKIPYLQRLRREKTDESYINAYLQAWHLSAAEVFGQ
jgi:hypothetical protein